jgi:hypothetical protein
LAQKQFTLALKYTRYAKNPHLAREMMIVLRVLCCFLEFSIRGYVIYLH